ncbi:hypothetical protein SCHPADRAFT_923906 [Schizopora paradoxa]|uniref:Uncharacterized protein n=1 Tax=Schizopora paradoxa TaxID=27342 RepID=A0A0H2S6Y9_9AGAM|nr:hypothetical protein SCHPADRAFT_923906 [Schizopora paradoxa]
MLRTYNSPTNLYFYARYLACRESETKYCFIQDDDYLILPSVLLNMHSYFLLNPNMTSLHLLPPHEHLSSRLRTVYEPENGIYSSFAWLGHGTFLRRSTMEEFLALLQELQFSEAERQMADNYFTILANKVPEIWFDHGIELGGGQPFTVGAEGQTRNERHISKAMEYLRATLEARKLRYMPYISEGSTRQNFIVNSSPIKHSSGVLSSNIKLFSRKLDLSKISDPNLHQDMSLDDDDIRAYIVNPLSNIVDGDPRTSFISPNGAEPGDWLVYDTLGPLDSNGSSVELVLLAEGATADMLTACTFSKSFGDKIWEILDTSAVCKETDLQSPNGGRLSECSIQMVGCDESSSFRAFKVTFSGPERKHVWSINEMFVRMVKD